MITVNTSIIKFLENAGCGEFGTNFFINLTPNSLKTPVRVWTVVQMPASLEKVNVTPEDIQRFPYTVYYRSESQEDAQEKIFALAKYISGCRCADLDKFTTIDVQIVSAQQGVYQDGEGRWVCSMAFAARLYNLAQSDGENGVNG